MAKLFSDIVGQGRAVGILLAHLNTENLSHAYLFVGSAGSGKEHLGRLFSRYILCTNHAEDDCENCTRFANMSHPDFILINGKEGIKIDDIRKAVERVNLSPALSAKKVLLILRADNMGIEAANALLKTLEEPPLDCIIILTAISEKSLPETIVSRVQTIKLKNLSEAELRKALLKEFPEAEIEKVLALSEGSLGNAKKMIAEPEFLKDKQKIMEDVSVLFQSKSIIEKFKIIEKYDKDKNIKAFFDVFSKIVFGALSAYLSDSENIFTEMVGSNYPITQLGTLGKKILKIYADLDYNISLRVALELIVLEELTSD